MAKLKVEVEGVEKTLTEIHRDLHRGMEKSVRRLADIAKEESRTVLELEDRIFNREVYGKYRYVETKNTPTQVTGRLVNYAEHAGAVEYGVDASEYADGGPPVQALLPWVQEKLSGSYTRWMNRDDDDFFEIDEESTPDESDVPSTIQAENFEYKKQEYEENIPQEEISQGDVLDIRGEAADGTYVVTNTYGGYVDATNYEEEINFHPQQMVFGGGYADVHAYGRVGEVTGDTFSEGDRVYNQEGNVGTVTLVNNDEIIVEFSDQFGTFDNAERFPTQKFYPATDADISDDTSDDYDFWSQFDAATNGSVDLSGIDKESSQDILYNLDDLVREYELPPPKKIVTDSSISSLNEAINPTRNSGEIKIASDLIEPGGYIEGIEKANENVDLDKHRRAYIAAENDVGAEYAMLYQYGEYAFENLNSDGKQIIADKSRLYAIDSDGDLVAEDSSVSNRWDKYSKLSGNGIKNHFAESFAAQFLPDNKAHRQAEITGPGQTDFFDTVLANPSKYFDGTNPDGWERPDYRLGDDYQKEPIRESDIPDGYTLDFEPEDVENVDELSEGEEYIVRNDDGELRETEVREVLRRNHHSLERNEDVATLKAHSPAEKFYFWGDGTGAEIVAKKQEHHEFANLDYRDYGIVKDYSGYGENRIVEDTHYVRVTSAPGYDDRSEMIMGEGTDIVTGETVEIHQDDFVGLKRTNPDKWLSDVDQLEDTPQSEFPDDITTSFNEDALGSIFGYKNHEDRYDGQIFVEDKVTGETYPAKIEKSSSRKIKFRSTEVDEYGNHKKWDYYYDTSDGDQDVNIKGIPNRYWEFHELQEDDDIIVNPEDFDSDSHAFPEDKPARATVSSISGNKIYVKPWGQNTENRLNYEAYDSLRENVGWMAYQAEKGDRMTFEVDGETHEGYVGHVPPDKQYQVSKIRVFDLDDNERRRITVDEYVDHDEDAEFTDEYEEPETPVTNGASEFVNPPDKPTDAEKSDVYLLWSYREGKIVKGEVSYTSSHSNTAKFNVIEGANRPYKWSSTDIDKDTNLYPVKPLGYIPD